MLCWKKNPTYTLKMRKDLDLILFISLYVVTIIFRANVIYTSGNLIIFQQCFIKSIVHMGGLFANLKNRRLAIVNIVW